MKQSKSKPNKDKTIIGDEWSGEDNPEYSCSWCNRILSKLIDSSGQNHYLSIQFASYEDRKGY
jgi:hypothetical protein